MLVIILIIVTVSNILLIIEMKISKYYVVV